MKEAPARCACNYASEIQFRLHHRIVEAMSATRKTGGVSELSACAKVAFITSIRAFFPPLAIGSIHGCDSPEFRGV
jgi:hypothetical protein